MDPISTFQMLRRVVVFASLLLVFSATTGCADGELEGGCEPGEAQACTCPDGTDGTQHCLDDRSFTNCVCDNGTPEENGCGGQSELILDGEPAEPGDSCGPCDDGQAVCTSEESLTCQGASEPNDCGGCTELDASPGEPCGDGNTWECDGPDALFCNPCEDHEALVSLGGEEQCLATCTDDPECEDNEYCHDVHGVCVPDDEVIDENSCGGTATLDGEPGQPCAAGAGEWECAGLDAVTCNCFSPDEFYDPTHEACLLEDQALCEVYCDIIYGCLGECNVDTMSVDSLVNDCLTGVDASDIGCYDDVGANRETYEDFVYADFDSDDPDARNPRPNTCSETRWLRCGQFGVWEHCSPSCQPPNNVGSICTATDDCDDGELLFAECLGPRDGQGNLVDDGYCTAATCFIPGPAEEGDVNVDGGCGAGNGCVAAPIYSDGGLGGICYELCSSNNDCDGDLACQYSGDLYSTDGFDGSPSPIGLARTCSVACESNSDCGTAARCNDVGICELPCGDGGNLDAICNDLGGNCVSVDGGQYCSLS